MKKYMYSNCLVVLFLFIHSCAGSGSNNKDNGVGYDKKKLTANECVCYNFCFVMRPVQNASSADNFTANLEEEIPRDMRHLVSQLFKRRYSIDTSMLFETNYERQKVISFSYKCFNKLETPDSCFIVEIFKNSQPNTMVLFGSIEFVKSYQKVISNYGKTHVYEYDLTGAPMQATQKIYLFLNDKNHAEADDYKGYAFCADGIKWYTSTNASEEAFSLINWVRPNKQYEVLLYFQEDKFIPVGHSKVGKWED